MITKERLEELIEQGIPIYWRSGKLYPHKWNKYTIISRVLVKGNLDKTYLFEELFESKETLDWYKEFGCIERTERLELPTWEEAIDLVYSGSFGVQTIIKFDKCKFGYKLQLDGNVYIFVDKGTDTLFMGSLTKENYTLACRKAKELFLGE